MTTLWRAARVDGKRYVGTLDVVKRWWGGILSKKVHVGTLGTRCLALHTEMGRVRYVRLRN
jgi:hypothetical protein